ncbi:1-aminocyclopropane-1-carboxylate synthase-like protein 1 [Penicillium rolfsii]|nr:1-aminocyclopropane-1-carboxylate synthase-like protein 1 [Penicillium rolfsii]
MLSTRGEAYAKAGLANGYLGPRKAPFDKDTKQGVVSFSNAENFLMQDVMLEFIRTQAVPNLDSTNLTYHEGPFGSSRLRAAMANLIKTYFHPVMPVSPEHIVFTNGVTSLNSMCALCLTNPGDGILLGQPIYGSFTGDLRVLSGCQLIYTPFHREDQFSAKAVARYEESFLKARDETGVQIRALLISNPHNPLGRCYSREALEALLQFCHKYQIHLISDEVYGLSVYENDDPTGGFVSVLSIDPAPLGVDPALIHVLYGMSKDFAAAGLRLGCLISQNKTFLEAALSLSVAGFFLWIDLSKCLDQAIVTSQGGWAAEVDLSRRLQQIGVVMASGYAYHNEVPGWFRVIFSVEVESLKTALSRITQLYHSSGNQLVSG